MCRCHTDAYTLGGHGAGRGHAPVCLETACWALTCTAAATLRVRATQTDSEGVFPVIFGHEGGGVVESVGEGCAGLCAHAHADVHRRQA